MKKALKKFAIWAPLAGLFVLMTGCATIYGNTRAYLGTPEYPPTVAANVQVLPAAPAEPITRLGEIVLSIDGNPPRHKIEDRLKTGAARLGADGVYIASDRTHIYPYVYWDYWGPTPGEDWHRTVVGIAFKRLVK
jgi:hypothetical protein